MTFEPIPAMEPIPLVDSDPTIPIPTHFEEKAIPIPIPEKNGIITSLHPTDVQCST